MVLEWESFTKSRLDSRTEVKNDNITQGLPNHDSDRSSRYEFGNRGWRQHWD